jgi:GNAT superfamily N-acetyltransferase
MMPMDNSEDVSTRPFEAADAETVSRLIIEDLSLVNIQDYGESAVRQFIRFYSPSFVAEYALAGDMLVADANEEIIATVTLEDGRVRNLFVRPDCHRLGLGRLLMARVEDLAREKGLTKLTLQAGLSAVEFYQKIGYSRTGEITERIGSAQVKMVMMEKVL